MWILKGILWVIKGKVIMKRKHTKLHEWQKRRDTAKCEKCGTTENITIDHIIPVVILEPLYLDSPLTKYDFIYNDEENFQFLCQYCNKLKGTRLDVRNPKTIPLLKRLIKDLEGVHNSNISL